MGSVLYEFLSGCLPVLESRNLKMKAVLLLFAIIVVAFGQEADEGWEETPPADPPVEENKYKTDKYGNKPYGYKPKYGYQPPKPYGGYGYKKPVYGGYGNYGYKPTYGHDSYGYWGTPKSVMYWKLTVSKLPSFQILNWPYSIMLSVMVNSSSLVTSALSLL